MRTAAMEGPRSADPILSHGHSIQQLRLQQPLSAPPVAHDAREIYDGRASEDFAYADDRESWVDFGSAHGSESNRSSMESHPDIDSVLAALQDHAPYHHTSTASGSGSSTDAAHLGRPSTDSAVDADIDADYPDPRSTQFFDADEDEDDGVSVSARYSMWSEAGGGGVDDRRSIMDAARSSESRAKLMKRVAQMYSKEGIEQGLVPPVPAMPSPRRNFN